VGGLLSASGPLCENCDFLRWGSWVSVIAFNEHDDNQSPRVATTIGWWVTGNLPTDGEIASIDQGSATYDGTTIGTVIQRVGYNDWVPYEAPAVGTVHMDWNFGPRSGTLEIIDFKAPGANAPPAINLSGPMSTPGQLDSNINRFAGSLGGTAGQNPISGFASGSFARNGTNPVGGIVGNWSASNPNLKANAIFGASQSTFNPNPGR
jgi:hypothetical protein